ncbi:alpha/beta fold hydrolase [Chengkuizengella axinellae]|uniref:Alpha/beta hydrolase n=1 Tax=Chengkuizengella axinellae TaxID=3064388 RepID=A0ABT9IXN5_9BACL|nr:alpha/beta hydrolase [Chengkuizengella sp. 2205SS18-9]MDP5274111.1 alpha/beta hydrolase [Chengkuizengella sp. 2205SS18-9]
MFKSRTSNFKDSNKNVLQNSIASIEMIKIGGVDQCILARGKNKNNPILLFLHGGPGTAQIGFAPKLQSKLEDDFVVINWDQRGAGKSFSRDIPVESMNINQFVSDAHEIIEILLERLGKEKLYLVGHSWGSVIGSLIAKKYPEKIHAYIGVGQVVNMKKNEEISYGFTLDKAKETNNKQAVKELNKIGYPPYANIKDTFVQRKWLNKFGGSMYEGSALKLVLKSISFREYSFLDWLRFMKNGEGFSVNNLWGELMETNLFKQIEELKVPVYFCVGRFDYQTSFELVEEFYHQLDAPIKDLIWFEKSAHAPNFEEPEKFLQVCRSAVQ